MTEDRLSRVVRGSALYDLLVTWPFATPWSFMALHGLLQQWHEAWQLPGAWPVMTPLTVLMGNLMGTVVVVWALARWRHPTPTLGALDTAARLAFAAWQLHAFTQGVTPLVLGFTVLEVAFGLWQGWALWQWRQGEQRRPARIG